MNVLVANLGSTSFKYKLFTAAASGEGAEAMACVATGASERIGQGLGTWSARVTPVGGEPRGLSGEAELADHAEAIELHLGRLIELGALSSVDDLGAIGFKAVHGGPISGAVRVDDQVLWTMQRFADVAPAHNPPYIAAMRAFARRLPDVPQVAAFETAFHQSIPLARQVYGVPHAWIEEHGVRRYGFHGASHRYIGERMAELAPEATRVISLHLGGSCSVCAIASGRSVMNSFGMTVQSGVFHNNRVGDFDAFALTKLLKAGMDLDEIWRSLGRESGMLGLSGVSADMRDVEEAMARGDARAKLAFEAFVEHCRHYVGSALMALGGVDALVFTGGIGQHGAAVRSAIAAGMDFAGVTLDEAANGSVGGDVEQRIDAGGGAAGWVLPTNEELVVARQTVAVLRGE